MYSNVTICNYPKCNSFWKNVRLQFIVERVKIPGSLDFTGFKGTKNTVPAAIALSAKTVLSVRLQGFEPWTP